MHPLLSTLLTGLALTVLTGARAAPTRLVSFPAADGLTVYANYTPAPTGAPLILLFHQADSNKSEYETTAPRLNRAGFGTLAVDARSGHATYAGEKRNLTADAYEKKTGDTAGFGQAYPDLEAALRWAKTAAPGHKLLVLGSSYSANLVFRLAADHPRDVAAVLAFSPVPGDDVRQAAPRVRVPVFITSAGSGGEVEAARQVLRLVGSPHKTQFVPESGPHGASALAPLGDPAAERYWQALLAFLAPLK
ncbi:alpha/beta hydrolase [Deinococcus aluminii]|uniref:Serine aminopeptidase S33 domain-containing protein n=1 Tax=Deinococcus aluminii TaxID=1656885 RepID=A0ABP9XD21_9DEIO